MERAAWTDERLDDLARRMDAGFERVDADIRELWAELRTTREELRADIGELRSLTLRFGGGLIAGIAAVLVTVLAHG
jgi:hypothetical protein